LLQYKYIENRQGEKAIMRLLIADDHKLLRESLKYVIENKTDFEIVGYAANGEEAFELCQKLLPDLVIMDIAMPVCNGIEATKKIKDKFPGIKVLMLTASYDGIDFSVALQNGADGYILKDVGTEELILSIQSTALGLGIIQKEFLNSLIPMEQNKEKKPVINNIIDVEGTKIKITDRQRKIIEMIVEGYDNKAISTALFIAEGTVKNNISEIISKLKLRDRTQLAVFAIKNNLV
jgi:DNA-binding NarL/FixJ family response regulator